MVSGTALAPAKLNADAGMSPYGCVLNEIGNVFLDQGVPRSCLTNAEVGSV